MVSNPASKNRSDCVERRRHLEGEPRFWWWSARTNLGDDDLVGFFFGEGGDFLAVDHFGDFLNSLGTGGDEIVEDLSDQTKPE